MYCETSEPDNDNLTREMDLGMQSRATGAFVLLRLDLIRLDGLMVCVVSLVAGALGATEYTQDKGSLDLLIGSKASAHCDVVLLLIRRIYL